MKQVSDSCERNQAPILTALEQVIPTQTTILEIGSGTGQHAVYFAERKPSWRIQPSDRPGTLASIEAWRVESGLSNIAPAIELDATEQWPGQSFEVIYTANTLHIMSATDVEVFFQSLPACLAPAGWLCVYGPFKHDGEFTSPSNAQFDQWLKARDPLSGIRDFEWLVELTAAQSLSWQETILLPANNELLIFRR